MMKKVISSSDSATHYGFWRRRVQDEAAYTEKHPVVHTILTSTVRFLTSRKYSDYSTALNTRLRQVEGMLELAAQLKLEGNVVEFLKQHKAVLRERCQGDR